MFIQIAKMVLLNLLSVASIIKLYLSLAEDGKPHPYWFFGALSLSVFIVLIVGYDIIQLWRKKPKSFDGNSPDIIKYMRKWVSRPGRTIIFSRDLTWANDFEAKKALRKKAGNGELTILVESQNVLTAELQAAGASIITYGKLGHVPRSRFTIIGFKKEGARVAIGAPIGDKHVVEEFQSGMHPLFGVTEDLVQFLINADKQKI